jgi:transcriptional regulator with XRE-family HTH domain
MTELPVCDCSRASHEHGTRDMYGWHRCRCLPCQKANRDYYRVTAHLTRKHRWVKAEPARRRIIVLREAGLSIKAMAKLCDVYPSQLQNLIYGPKGRVVKRIRASTLAALNAITYSDVVAVSVPARTRANGAASARQLRALQAAGWSLRAVAARTGLGRGTLGRILAGGNTIEDVRVRVAAAHSELRVEAPPSETRYDRSASGAGRATAAANGWTIDEDEDFAYEDAA